MKHLLTTVGRLPFPWRAFIAVFTLIAAVGLISVAPSQAAPRPSPAQAAPAQAAPAQLTSQRAATREAIPANCWTFFIPRVFSEVKCDTVVNGHTWYFCGTGSSTFLSAGFGVSFNGRLTRRRPSTFFTDTTNYKVTAQLGGLHIDFYTHHYSAITGLFGGHPIGGLGHGEGHGRWHPSFCR